MTATEYQATDRWFHARAASRSAARTDAVLGIGLATLLLMDWLVVVAVVFGLVGGWFDA